MKRTRSSTFGLVRTALVAVLLLGFGTLSVGANGPVVPPQVIATLQPGESLLVEKKVTTPELPPKLDLLLLEDETGSFADDIDTLQGTLPDCSDGLAAAIWDGITAEVPDFQGGVAGFRDFDQSPWGNPGDHVYRLLQDLTSVKATWLSGICSLSATGGADTPEAQLAALKSAADGSAWDSDGDGDPPYEANDTQPDQDPSWRVDADVTKVVVLVTDAPYHVGNTYPGPSYADTITALNGAGIHVIALVTSGQAGTYASLATDTGGSVELISADSSDIVDAILDALEALTTDVWWTAVVDSGLLVTLDPLVHENVPGATTVAFAEEISVPNGSDPDTSATLCGTVTFIANEYPAAGAPIGEQEICITVVVIDIKPGSFPNSINTKSKGVVPVAILGSDTFDVTTVDVTTLEFGPLGATPAHDLTDPAVYADHLQDVNDDGYVDLVSHYRQKDTGLAPGDLEACLTGEASGIPGSPFTACDSVNVVK